jgi:hypothetical protein
MKVQLLGPERKLNAAWMNQMIELVEQAAQKTPRASQSCLGVWTNDWLRNPKNGKLFERLEAACMHAKTVFEVGRRRCFVLRRYRISKT